MKNLINTLLLLTASGMIWQVCPAYAEHANGSREDDLVIKTDEKETNENFKEKVFWTESVDDPLVYDSKEELMKKTMGDTQHEGQGEHQTFSGETDENVQPEHGTFMSEKQAEEQRQKDFEDDVDAGKYDELIPKIPDNVA